MWPLKLKTETELFRYECSVSLQLCKNVSGFRRQAELTVHFDHNKVTGLCLCYSVISEYLAIICAKVLMPTWRKQTFYWAETLKTCRSLAETCQVSVLIKSGLIKHILWLYTCYRRFSRCALTTQMWQHLIREVIIVYREGKPWHLVDRWHHRSFSDHLFVS